MFQCFRPTLRKLEPHSMYEIWVRILFFICFYLLYFSHIKAKIQDILLLTLLLFTGGWHWWRAHSCLCWGRRPRYLCILTSLLPPFININIADTLWLLFLTCELFHRRLWIPWNSEGGGTGEHRQPQPQHHLDRPWQFPSGINYKTCSFFQLKWQS